MISNSLSLVYALLTIILVFMGIIAFLRFLFASIYATGNENDPLLLELMNSAGLPNWQALQNKSGVSRSAIWLLRDGDAAALKVGELSQIATALSVRLPDLLQKLGLLTEGE